MHRIYWASDCLPTLAVGRLSVTFIVRPRRMNNASVLIDKSCPLYDLLVPFYRVRSGTQTLECETLSIDHPHYAHATIRVDGAAVELLIPHSCIALVVRDSEQKILGFGSTRQ